MWQLADGRLPRHDGTFPPPEQGKSRDRAPDEMEEATDGEMTAQLIWHHDVSNVVL